MNFTGKICPYCKTEFAEGDDIVVCSVCEMPHHKECWIENKACTTFGCTGTMAGAEYGAQAVEHQAVCAQCGAPLRDEQKFCSQCGLSTGVVDGTQFRVETDPTASRQQNVDTQQQEEDDLHTLIGVDATWYISRFEKMAEKNTKVSWNWASFLFLSYWFAYRKMYGLAAIYGVILFMVGSIPEIGALLSLIVRICLGIFGNYQYQKHVYDKLDVAQSMSPSDKSAYLAKKGGTSVGAVFAAIGIAAVVGFVAGIIIYSIAEGFAL